MPVCPLNKKSFFIHGVSWQSESLLDVCLTHSHGGPGSPIKNGHNTLQSLEAIDYASGHTHIPCDESRDPLQQRSVEAYLALIYPVLLLRYVSCADSSAKMTIVQRGVSAGNMPTRTSNGGGMDSLMEHSEESILGYVRAWAGFNT